MCVANFLYVVIACMTMAVDGIDCIYILVAKYTRLVYQANQLYCIFSQCVHKIDQAPNPRHPSPCILH